MTGIIFDIKHYAVNDGPGIRTTVFFKGCPLGCWWCHNPESRNAEIQTIEHHFSVAEKQFCELQTVGKQYTAKQILAEVEKDRIFYDETGGGVTLSGGEPLYQPDFLLELLAELKKADLHTALDTTGFCAEKTFEKVLENTDLLLFDLKHLTESEHLKYTGVPLQPIIKNLELAVRLKKQIQIRFPVIPNINDSEENISRTIQYLQKLQLSRISLLPYHSIAKHKYEKFGIENKMLETTEFNQEFLLSLREKFSTEGFDVTLSS
ncbi:MAG TPA: glycyl-radical enzyme activating protein [Bacteroidales bacterium]|nr:glycyl-radical enzyme activating protein [Bacteroidales bacterium]